MKIICSKHQKDYYDHLVSYYGYDDHIVYDRRKSGDISCLKWNDRFIFYICGETIPVIKKGRHFIFDARDERLNNTWAVGVGRGNFERDWMEKWYKRPTKINAELRQPVLCSTDYFGVGERKYFVPRLESFGFAGQIQAHEMYQKIYAFLSWLKDNPEPPNNQANKEKIISHGHDPKTSFRPKMKD